MICFFLHLRCSAVWGLPAFSLDQTHSIKTLFISLRAKRGSHSTLLRVHEEVNTLPRWGWIEQSDAHIIQATVQTDWQLLGKTSHVSAWDRGRARERERQRQKRKGLSVVAVMLSETLPQCYVPLLCISHCWRPSLSGQSSVSSETSDSLLECPRGNSSPRQGAMDGRTHSSSTAIPSPCLQAKSIQRDCTIWLVTCPASEKKCK